MNRKRLETGWHAVRPLMIYLILFLTIRSVLYHLWDTLLFDASEESAVWILSGSGIAEILIIGLSAAGAAIPLLKEGRREILLLRAGSGHAWILKRKDRRLLMTILPFGTLCLCILLNLLLAGGEGAGQADIAAYAVPIGAAVYGILTPFVEEMIYRGIVWRRLRKSFSPLEAAFVSSLFFGIAHAGFRQGVYAFVMGMVFAMSLELTRRFEVPFLLHCVCNLTVLYAAHSGFLEVLGSDMWIVFFAVSAAATFFFWIRRIIETNYKL